ncbi:NAD(P)/FAD-dependent oxidoreductase [Hyella patelloides]|uniref:NAD(P)/FAD-dependent oxidoreductase n=1 Tax=Hyella patelloides TaxID=1982969 RepID=UPI0011A85CF9|nr:NAD(P)/FAD-dependent oxidoreductase [Hyella patelloides]
MLKRPKIVVIGAGFAGLRTVKKLALVNAEILVIDRNNYHTFIPLLYQVASGFIPPKAIAYPLEKALRSIPNARFLQAEVQTIDLAAKVITTNITNVSYDYLVLATGSQAKFLGVEGASEYALPMKTLDDAIKIRDRIINNFEQATICQDFDCRRQLLTIAIIGGGATGVELAGALIELAKGTLFKNYPTIKPQEFRIILIHSGARLLADFPHNLGEYTSKQLRRRGVKVHLQSRVYEVFPGAIELDDGTILETATTIWTTGVEANYPQPEVELPIANKEKICVTNTLQLPNYPEVYAVGDVAFIRHRGEPLLGIAPEALQQGTAVAKNLQRQLQGLPPQPFNYFNKGTAAIIARNSGVAYLLGRIPLKGFFAWLLWLGIHLYYLPGVANRGVVLGSWLRDYLTRKRDIRQLGKCRQIPQSPNVKLSRSFTARKE